MRRAGEVSGGAQAAQARQASWPEGSGEKSCREEVDSSFPFSQRPSPLRHPRALVTGPTNHKRASLGISAAERVALGSRGQKFLGQAVRENRTFISQPASVRQSSS